VANTFKIKDHLTVRTEIPRSLHNGLSIIKSKDMQSNIYKIEI
jgi:hypothetical protein